jgi:hypothetical protein
LTVLHLAHDSETVPGEHECTYDTYNINKLIRMTLWIYRFPYLMWPVRNKTPEHALQAFSILAINENIYAQFMNAY